MSYLQVIVNKKNGFFFLRQRINTLYGYAQDSRRLKVTLRCQGLVWPRE